VKNGVRAKQWDEGKSEVRGGSNAGGFINIFIRKATGFH